MTFYLLLFLCLFLLAWLLYMVLISRKRQ